MDNNLVITVQTRNIPEAKAQMAGLQATIEKLTVKANGTVVASGRLTETLNQQANSTNKVAAATNTASRAQENYFLHIAKTTVQSALVNKAFLGLVEAAGKAVKQVDLFQNFPASMAALGLSSSDASASLKVLQQYIGGIGGDLQEATTSVARFAEVTRNVKAATAEFVGVKNALIAGGAGAEVQSNALEQLIQSYSRGKPQLIEWRSLMVAMPAQLNQVAQAMNLPNAQALGEQLTQGKLSMQDFVTELTKLSTGTGPIAQQAIARMQGIEFASNVMKNALTNGLAAIYQAVGRQNIISFFSFLTQVIIVLASWAVNLINVLITLFNLFSKIFGGPQIAHFTGEAQGAAGALDDGANSAGDMADGLGNAADNAAKINKSLASFDKMNVLPDKTSAGSGDSGAGGTGGLSPTDASTLDSIFGDIGGKMAQISEAAKIFAGILAGIVALKFASPIISGLAGIISGFKDGATGADKFSKKLGGLSKTIVDSFKGNNGAKDAAKQGTTFGYAILNGLAGAVGAGAGKVWQLIVAPLIGVAAYALAIIGAIVVETLIAIGVVAATVALPFEILVAIGIAVVAAIVALIWLIWKNWDTIWGFIDKAAQDSWQFIQKVWDGTTDFFVGIWQGIYNAFIVVVNGIKKGFQSVIDFIKSHAQLFEVILSPLIFAVAIVILIFSGLVAFFKGIFDSIVSIFTGAPGFFGSVFSAAWDAVKAVWDFVVAYYAVLWNGIVAIFTVVATFFGTVFSAAWEAIKAVWSTVSAWFNSVVIQPLITIFTPVADFLSGVFSAAWNAIKAVWGLVVGFFGGVWGGITNIFAGASGFFGSVFSSAYNAITGVFSTLWSWFRDNVWNKIVSLFTTIGTTVGDAITNAFKGVINLVLQGIGGIWNKFVGILNGAIDIVKHLPGTGGLTHIDKWVVPQLARGGIIDQATMTMIGENGAEAVVPLENNTEWIDTLANKLNKSTNGGQPLQLVVQIGEDKIASKIIDLINEKTQMSGRNAILV